MSHIDIIYLPMIICRRMYNQWKHAEGRDAKDIQMRLEPRDQHFDVEAPRPSHYEMLVVRGAPGHVTSTLRVAQEERITRLRTMAGQWA